MIAQGSMILLKYIRHCIHTQSTQKESSQQSESKAGEVARMDEHRTTNPNAANQVLVILLFNPFLLCQFIRFKGSVNGKIFSPGCTIDGIFTLGFVMG